MTSPLIREDVIKNTLSLPVVTEHIDQLNMANMLAILDGYDRKLLRDEFSKILSTGFQFFDASARLDLIFSLKKLFEAEAPQQKLLDEAAVGLTQRADHWRKRLYEIMEVVSQCPGDQDTIN
jgi:hypothetical protein